MIPDPKRFQLLISGVGPKPATRPEFGPDGELLWLPTPGQTHWKSRYCLDEHFPTERQVQDTLIECERAEPGFLRAGVALRCLFGPFLVITRPMACATCLAEWKRRN